MDRDEAAVSAALLELAMEPLPSTRLSACAIWRLAQARRTLAAHAREARWQGSAVALSVVLTAIGLTAVVLTQASAHPWAFATVGAACVAAALAALAMLLCAAADLWRAIGLALP